jgi:guanylate kinase
MSVGALQAACRIVVFTGPMAAGSHTVTNLAGSSLGLRQIIPYTTCPPGLAEADGQDFHFVSPAEFLKAERQKEFIEVTQYNGHLYGIKLADIEKQVENGELVCLDTGRIGAEILKERFGSKVIRVFIYSDPQTVKNRLLMNGVAKDEITWHLIQYEAYMEYKHQCDYVYNMMDIAYTLFDLGRILEKHLNRDLQILD